MIEGERHAADPVPAPFVPREEIGVGLLGAVSA
jgi:hypothetical protein